MGMEARDASLLLLLLSLVFHLLPAVSTAVSLTISPRTLTKSNATVHVAWSGVSAPSDLDWLGIYSPPDSEDDDFIGYVFLNSSVTGDWRSGAGAVEIPLVNLRHPYVFRLFRWKREEVNYKHHDHDQNPLPGTRHRLAASEEVAFEGSDGPDQIHLAFTDREDEMRVMFVTADGGESYVSYGLDASKLDQMAATVARRYERKDMCDFPANSSTGWRDPGFIHDGVMKNLEKGKKYYYTVGSDAGGWSKTHSFISRNSDSNETIAFLFGDMGTYTPYWTFYRIQEESKSTIKWILRDIDALGDKPAFVSHIGDISYARGFAWMWDEFFNQIEPIASRIPYHVCIGNHEYDWPTQPWRPYWSVYGVYGKDGGGECGVPYSVRFNMPGNSSLPTGTGSPDTQNLYYSFDSGVVHFVYISTETDFLRGSDQYNFIKADLESVNRSKTPFIVVQGHRPMYTTSNELRDAPLREKMLEHLEPLLVQNNVTLALWGHVHRYERFCPLNNFKCLTTDLNFTFTGAPVHMVIGMAGQDWQPIWEPRSDHPDVPIFPQPERSMYRGGEFGYTRLVATREKLTLSYIGNHDGQVHDMVVIRTGVQVTQENVTSEEKVVHAEQSSPHPTAFPYPWYVKAAVLTVLGVLVGYALGFFTRWRKIAAERATFAPVKNEEI